MKFLFITYHVFGASIVDVPLIFLSFCIQSYATYFWLRFLLSPYLWIWWCLLLLKCWSKFAPAFKFFMTKVFTNRTLYFIFKRRKVIIGTFLDSCYTPLISCFSSHDGFVSNTLSSLVPKVMTWKTLPIKEVSATIESFDIVYLLVVASIDIHPWSKLSMIYLIISFRPLLTIDILFTRLCCIKIASSGGWQLLRLRWFFSLSKTCLYQRRTLHFDNFI